MHPGKGKGGSNARPFRSILNPYQEVACVLALDLSLNFEKIAAERPVPLPFSKFRSSRHIGGDRKCDERIGRYMKARRHRKSSGLLRPRHRFWRLSTSGELERDVSRRSLAAWCCIQSLTETEGTGIASPGTLHTNLPDQNAWNTARVFRLCLHAFLNKMRAAERLTDPRRLGQYIQRPG